MAFRSTIILTALAASFASVQAAPANATAFVVLDSKNTTFGTLTYYGRPGAAVESVDAPALHRRCGANAINCDFGSNLAPAGVCDSLISAMQAAGSNGIPGSTRSVCLDPDNQTRCCASWSHPASFQEQNLVPAARSVRNSCNSNGGISGTSHDTLLGSTCLTQCLSNRPDGCAD